MTWTADFENLKATGVTPKVAKAFQAGEYDLVTTEQRSMLADLPPARLNDYIEDYPGA